MKPVHVFCYTDLENTRTAVGTLNGKQLKWLRVMNGESPRSLGDRALRRALRLVITQTSNNRPIKLTRSLPVSAALSVGRLPPSVRKRARERDIRVVEIDESPPARLVIQRLAESDEVNPEFRGHESSMFSPPYTVYADGSLLPKEGMAASIGYIIVDDDDQVIRMEGRSISPKSTSSEVEMIGAIEALKSSKELIPYSEDFILRVDDKRVVQYLTSERNPPDEEVAISEARTQFQCFRSRSVRHTPRERNRIADALADTGHSYNLLWTNPVAREIKQESKRTTKYSV